MLTRLADTLAEMATHHSLKCHKCKDRLRLWPDGRGPDFVCDGECGGGGSKSKIHNNGNNR